MIIENGIITWNKPDSKYDYLFDLPKGKHNTRIKLTEDDLLSGTKVYCKEPYAQSLYDFYTNKSSSASISKDLESGKVYEVIPISYDVNDKMVYCEEILSKSPVYIPLSECKDSKFDTNKGNKPFKIVATKTVSGAMYGSVKGYQKISSVDVLNDFLDKNTIFDVTVTDLIKGGFIVKYDGVIECFLPGAHAAANVIHDFNSYIGKTIKVMVDNYDLASKLFVVSHKKYINHSMPELLGSLSFTTKYSGKLTSNPNANFGLFVEFDNIPVTGLIHMAEFSNYNEICKKYKQGDSIEFYVKNISYKPSINKYTNKEEMKCRVILTTDISNVDPINITWSDYKTKLEGNTYSYDYNPDTQALSIIGFNNEQIRITVPHDLIKDSVFKKTSIKIINVDIINKQIGFDFI